MLNNNRTKLANIQMLQFIAEKLGELRAELVFLGGCTTAIFIDELSAPDVRFPGILFNMGN